MRCVQDVCSSALRIKFQGGSWKKRTVFQVRANLVFGFNRFVACRFKILKSWSLTPTPPASSFWPRSWRNWPIWPWNYRYQRRRSVEYPVAHYPHRLTPPQVVQAWVSRGWRPRWRKGYFFHKRANVSASQRAGYSPPPPPRNRAAKQEQKTLVVHSYGLRCKMTTSVSQKRESVAPLTTSFLSTAFFQQNVCMHANYKPAKTWL